MTENLEAILNWRVQALARFQTETGWKRELATSPNLRVVDKNEAADAPDAATRIPSAIVLQEWA
jgi:hypothetical protein